jgi:hypothetical protein
MSYSFTTPNSEASQLEKGGREGGREGQKEVK